MTAQLHLANVIVEGRARTDQDLALLRTVELALEQERGGRRRRGFFRR
jgi:hypothetical protein